MLVHPWDAATGESEWRTWLNTTAPFGSLVVANAEPARAPFVIPAHAVLQGEILLLHLARPNPVWPHVKTANEVKFAIVGDYAFIPGNWRPPADGPEEDGVPTSYYAAVQFTCRPEIIDDAEGKAAILREQFAHLQPEGGHSSVEADLPPFDRQLPGIRGLVLHILGVEAKFKYDDHKPLEFRHRVAKKLDTRAGSLDRAAALQQRRRSELKGEWKPG